MTFLVNWLETVNVPPSAVALVERYTPVAVVMREFYRKQMTESRTTSYPLDPIRRATRSVPLGIGGAS